MAEQGFPGQHTTTTTVTTSSTAVHTNIRYDPTYVKTIPGLIKCAEVVLNLLVFLFIAITGYGGGGISFTSFICGLGFWATGLLLVFYLFHVIEKFYKVPWLKIELIYSGLWCFFLLIGSSICVSYISHSATLGIVGFFGFIAMILYGYDAFLKFKGVQNGEIAQGERQVVKSTSTTSSPAAY